MKWKLILFGGVTWWLVKFIVGIATVTVIHMGIMRETYLQIPHFFRPELMQDPPDETTLMGYWIITGLLAGLLSAALYGWVQSAFKGSGWRRGLQFGLLMTLAQGAIFLVYSGVLNLPPKVYAGWMVDDLILNCIGGAAMGLVVAKFAAD